MKIKNIALLGLLGMSGLALAQECPNGIPAANNPSCLPPDNPMSPYYQDQGLPEQAVEPQRPPQPAGYWETTWGAVSLDSKIGQMGAVKDMDSKQSAKTAAIMECKNRGGGEGCQERVAIYDNQCVAVSWGKSFSSIQSAATIEQASALAAKKCNAKTADCQIYYADCSKPIFHRY